jgi:hypothetical protein
VSDEQMAEPCGLVCSPQLFFQYLMIMTSCKWIADAAEWILASFHYEFYSSRLP